MPVYIENERKVDVLLLLIDEAVEKKSKNLLQKISERYVLVAGKDENSNLERLLEKARRIEDSERACVFFQVISNLARRIRNNSILAKALWGEYQIRRTNKNTLTRTFFLARRLLDYVEDLDPKDRMEVYYKIGVHAYYLKHYDECIEIMDPVIKDTSNQHLWWKEQAVHTVYNSYIQLGKFEEAEFYLNKFIMDFNKLNDPNVVLDRALIQARKGNVTVAKSMLTEFIIKYPNDFTVLPAINELLRIKLIDGEYISQSQFTEYEKLINQFLHIETIKGPFLSFQYGIYLRQKGQILLLQNQISEAITSLLGSMKVFVSLNLRDEFLRSLRLIYLVDSKHNSRHNSHLLEEVIPQLLNELIGEDQER